MKLNERKTQIETQLFDQLTEGLESQVLTLLHAFKPASNASKSKNTVSGFNRPDKKGDTILALALKKKMTGLAR